MPSSKDLHHSSQEERRHDPRTFRPESPYRHSFHEQRLSQSTIHHLPQRRWEDIPLPYRPRDWRDPREELRLRPANSLFSWRHRSSEREAQEPVCPSSTVSRQGRRSHVLRNLYPRREGEQRKGPTDLMLSPPSASPYDDAQSTYGAPNYFAYVPRSVSQPSTPTFGVYSNAASGESNVSSSTLSSGGPIYPPSSRRRPRSTANGTDATFTDEEEFQLFVQATAGLGPEQAFRHTETQDEGRSRAAGGRGDARGGGRSAPTVTSALDSHSDQLVSPIQSTPTAMAWTHLTSMPRSSRHSAPRLVTDAACAPRPHVDMWLHPPTADCGEEEVSPIEEEVPDYAQSQAQVQVAMRAEATRRAQELARRWQQSR